MEKLKPLYFVEGEKVGGNALLPDDYRFKLLKGVRDLCWRGVEIWGLPRRLHRLSTAACDGSWLLPPKEDKQCKLA